MGSEYRWSGDDLLKCTGKRLAFSQHGVKLRKGITLADELGKCNDRDRENISGMRVARKVFRIDRLSCPEEGEAKLCPYLECDRVGGVVEVTVNGHSVTHRWSDDRTYWTDRWTPIPIPTSWLVKGDNEVVFRALDDSAWTLLIESSRQPDLSAVSEDGGQTWRSEDLGCNNGYDGEYMVRLWLDQFPASATVESEVIDLLKDLSRDIAVSGIPERLSLACEVETPASTSAVVAFRSGPVPEYDPGCWSAWKRVDGTEVTPDGRFGQWQVILSSENPAETPTLQSVILSTGVSKGLGYRVVNRSEESVEKSSYRFASATHDDPRSERLKDRWQLEDVVRGATSEWESYLRLRQWVRDQWENGWDMGEIDFCPPWDAILILELTRRNLSLGMCTHYATVMSQCCAALGLNARTQIMKCHCINEVWSTDHNKWAAMDVGGDNDDETKFVYHFERDGIPLSAGECHEAWVTQSYDDVRVSPEPPAVTKGRYEVKERLQLFERFMISLRTDELRSLEPGESEHGKGSYHYDGYLFWEDESTASLPWFSNHTTRRSDLYWSVNQTYLHLQDGQSGTGSGLRVVLESPTPNLAGFERSFDGEAWEPAEQSFPWLPEDEGHTLFARSVNHLGNPGVSSEIKVSRVD